MLSESFQSGKNCRKSRVMIISLSFTIFFRKFVSSKVPWNGLEFAEMISVWRCFECIWRKTKVIGHTWTHVTVSGGTKEYNEAKKLCHKKKFDMTPRQKRTPKKKKDCGGPMDQVPHYHTGLWGTWGLVSSWTLRRPLGHLSETSHSKPWAIIRGHRQKWSFYIARLVFHGQKKIMLGCGTVWSPPLTFFGIKWHILAYLRLWKKHALSYSQCWRERRVSQKMICCNAATWSILHWIIQGSLTSGGKCTYQILRPPAQGESSSLWVIF